jgi:hypothetical protein
MGPLDNKQFGFPYRKASGEMPYSQRDKLEKQKEADK